MSLVIVGNGMVCARLCEGLAQSGVTASRDVIVLGDEGIPAYDRVRLSELFATSSGPESFLIRPASWYERSGIRIHTKERVQRIDRDERCVETESGRRIRYTQLVLATGAAVARPPIEGIHAPAVQVYRSAADREAIERGIRPGARVAILGGGLLGLELAEAMARRGCDVSVLEQAPRLLPRHLDARAATIVADRADMLGIRVRCGTRVARVDASHGSARLHLDDAETIDAEIVVVATGVRPRDELARAAGLECHWRGGVQVDDALLTSDPSIAAIGECAIHRDTSYGVVAPGYAMAEVLADRIAGGNATFTGATFATRLALDGLDVAIVGESQESGPSSRALTLEKDGTYRRIVLRDHKLVGAIAVGAWPALPRVQEAIARGERVRGRAERRFHRSGEVWPSGSTRAVASWPDHAIVCTCTGTTCGALRRARASGCGSAEQLAEATRASTVCGGCTPLLRELCGQSTVAVAPRRTTLVAGSLAAATFTIAFLALPPIAVPATVQVDIDWDALWRSSGNRQMTGFGLLGVCLATLLLPLRKRLHSLRIGAFDAWRSAHALLGTAAIALVALHTGLQTGQRLNFALAVTFLALIASGSASGVGVALESRLGQPWGGHARRATANLHWLLAYPLAVLIGFHVLVVYYF